MKSGFFPPSSEVDQLQPSCSVTLSTSVVLELEGSHHTPHAPGLANCCFPHPPFKCGVWWPGKPSSAVLAPLSCLALSCFQGHRNGLNLPHADPHPTGEEHKAPPPPPYRC